MEASNPYQTPAADVTSPSSGEYDQSGPFSPGGRFGRLSYLAWGMLMAIPLWVAAVFLGIAAGVSGAGAPEAMSFSMIALQLLYMIPMVIFAIRRLHDFDASGWWAVLSIVPLANVVLGLVLLLRRGNEGANRFAPPRLTRGWERVLGFIGIVMVVVAVIGIIAAVAIPMFVAGRA